jgi:toxin ParE1/3/4
MKFIINWTDFANQDLNDIIDYMIDNGDINNAKNIYLKIKERCVLLELNPNQGRIVPEFEKLSIIKYREIIVKPWRIIYKVEKNAIYILVVIDGRRNTEEILLEKITKNRA